jgi:hypothetical protein
MAIGVNKPAITNQAAPVKTGSTNAAMGGNRALSPEMRQAIVDFTNKLPNDGNPLSGEQLKNAASNLPGPLQNSIAGLASRDAAPNAQEAKSDLIATTTKESKAAGFDIGAGLRGNSQAITQNDQQQVIKDQIQESSAKLEENTLDWTKTGADNLV